jgi:hypothetical protein
MSSSNSDSSSVIVVASNTIIVLSSQRNDSAIEDDKKLKDEEKLVQPTSEYNEVDDEQGSTSQSLERARMEWLIAWARLNLVRNRSIHISSCRINMFSSCNLRNLG